MIVASSRSLPLLVLIVSLPSTLYLPSALSASSKASSSSFTMGPPSLSVFPSRAVLELAETSLSMLYGLSIMWVVYSLLFVRARALVVLLVVVSYLSSSSFQ